VIGEQTPSDIGSYIAKRDNKSACKPKPSLAERRIFRQSFRSLGAESPLLLSRWFKSEHYFLQLDRVTDQLCQKPFVNLGAALVFG
jgi:hypothetical protein